MQPEKKLSVIKGNQIHHLPINQNRENMKWIPKVAIMVWLYAGTSLYAQSLTQTIRGTVVDTDSRTPLIGVTLYIDGSDPIIGTITNNSGNFQFNDLPIGRYNIGISYIGYENKIIPNILLGSGKEVVLNLELAESVEKLDEVVIAARKNKGEPLNDMSTVSARSISVEETQRFAGSFNDPSRLVSSYAGVMGDPDGNNDIMIRGNSPRGLQWRLEGVDVPNPNHFANEGATGGPISILNTATLGTCDFFTGAFPAEYGEAYSGVFDVHLRKGNNHKNEFTAQLGIIGMDLTAEGPFTRENSASYLLNYRYSSLDLLNRIGVKVAGDAVPKFQDMTLNVNVPTNRFGTFQLFGIGGLSTISMEEDGYREEYSADMGVLGLNHIYPLSANTYLRSSLSFSGTSNYWDYYEMEEESNDLWQKRGYDNFVYTTYALSTTITHKFSARHTVKGGIKGKFLTYDLVMDIYDDDANELYRSLNDQGNSQLYESFVNWKYRPIEALTFNSGVNVKYLALNGNYAVEPRIGARWQISPRQAFTAAFGLHSKTDNISLYLMRERQDDGSTVAKNKDLDFLRARHYVIGYEYRISRNLNLKSELYYQDLFDVPVGNDPESAWSILNASDGYIIGDLINQGTGTNYGIELSLDKYFADRYYFLLTGSLFESKYTALKPGDYNTRFNNNYIANIVGGKEFPVGKQRNASINVNIRGSYAGGQYYTPIDEDRSREAGYTIRDEERIYAAKRDDYMRFDLKVSYRKNRKNMAVIYELDIQNVTNSLNVTGDYWDNDTESVETYSQLGLLPTLNIRVEF